RRRIAGALAAGGTTSAETAALDALLDADPGVIDAACRSLIGKLSSLSKDHRRAMVDQILDMLKTGKGARLPLPSEIALVRLLAALEDPRREAVFWARLDPKLPVDLRAAAVQALGTLPVPSNKDKIKTLLACAVDPDFRVAAPALMILKTLPVTARNLPDWLALFDAPDPAARRFAIVKVGAQDSPEVAARLLDQIRHPDRSLREEALAALGRLEQGRQALAQALLEAPTLEEAWTLARAQAPWAREYTPALRTRIFHQTCAYLEAGDRRADPLLFLLREVDPRDLRDRLEEKALALRKKKQYAAALIYLRLLTRDPSCGEAIRFEAAVCALRLSNHDLAPDSRAADPALQQFAGLIHRHDLDPMEFVEKAKWLDPEDLFYLGFHFAEGSRPEKEFGRRVLELLIRRSARSKLAKDARSKLRSEGLT
ncbi:MAG: HEAT repeat domain-containing protein, partial [Planctomycetes bacterium]|nr:HEAT repeat domain-containing protein [Planctomycetota bacterium]